MIHTLENCNYNRVVPIVQPQLWCIAAFKNNQQNQLMGSSHSSAGHAKPSIFWAIRPLKKKTSHIFGPPTNQQTSTDTAQQLSFAHPFLSSPYRQLLTPNQIIENLLEVHLCDEPTLAA